MSDTTPRDDASMAISSTGGSGTTAVEVGRPDEPAPKSSGPIVGKSPGKLAWARLRRDRLGLTFGAIVFMYVLVAANAWLVQIIYGQDGVKGHSELLNTESLPLGYLGGIDFTKNNPSGQIHILGVEPQTGRDIFMQLVYGARTSLTIAFSASILSILIGIAIGVTSAYLGGWFDAVVNWFIDFMLAFPFLLLAIAAIPIVNTWLGDSVGYVSPSQRISTIIAIFAIFGWMGTARLVRGQVLSLREREYVEAARAAGASVGHILFKQILPNLWAPILVTFALSVPATVTGEAALSFLNIGVVEPTPDWGRMLGNSFGWMQEDPAYTIIPGLSLFILVLSFNLFGDSVRDALDPKSLR